MTKEQKQKILTKRAIKAKETLCCCNEQARTYAREYAKYLEETPINARCLCFEDRLEN